MLWKSLEVKVCIYFKKFHAQDASEAGSLHVSKNLMKVIAGKFNKHYTPISQSSNSPYK